MSVELTSMCVPKQDSDTIAKCYPTLNVLEQALRNGWSKDTSVSSANWSCNQPSTGQCAVTALVIQKYLGGQIMRCDIPGGFSHYWNILDDGCEVDLTADQFEGMEVRIGCSQVSSTKLLDNNNTRLRYERLLHKVRKYLSKTVTRSEY